MYNIAYCEFVYDYFNKDFFQEELGTKLRKCTFLSSWDESNKELLRWQDSLDEDTYGVSITLFGHNYIWINPIIRNSKKLLINTILHEMIHLYVNQVQPEVRPYRMQHGSLWTHTAKYATELYGHEIGPIEQYATDSETKSYRHAYMMKTTRTLVNTYLVKLVSGDLVPVKDLTDEQLTELTAMNIAGIYRVLPGIEQRPGTRVSRYIDWETLVDCIENGIDADTEEVCNPLRIRLGEDTETIWVRRHHK